VSSKGIDKDTWKADDKLEFLEWRVDVELVDLECVEGPGSLMVDIHGESEG
jgi:hypothetical protein